MTERRARPTTRFFEWAPVRGVWRRELALFRRYWASSSFASLIEPTIYLLAFGFGFGSLVGHVAGYRYVDFVGTGVVATAALFTSVFPGMFNTYIRRTYQHSYDAIAMPVNFEHLTQRVFLSEKVVSNVVTDNAGHTAAADVFAG